MKSRKPKNHAEALCYDYLEKYGWECSKRGYPDFICKKGDEIISKLPIETI